MSETSQQLIERIERLEALLRSQTTPGVKEAEEAWLEKIRIKSRFQGLGEPVENPNLHRFLKYPGWRFHLTAEPRLVQTKQEDDALGEGWYRTMAEFEAAAKANAEPLPAKKAK